MGSFASIRISKLVRYGKLSWIEFYSCYLQQRPSIDLFSYWTPGYGQKGPNQLGLSFSPEAFLELDL